MNEHDDLNAARGIVIAVGISLAFWTAIVAIAWAVTH